MIRFTETSDSFTPYLRLPEADGSIRANVLEQQPQEVDSVLL